jgi:ATP-dependent Clp protease ATP-binding subunit ClpC
MTNPLPLTPRMQRTLQVAERIAREQSLTFVGTEHVLLALLDDSAGIAGGTIKRLGFTERVRAEVMRILDSDSYRPLSERASPRRPHDF